MHAYATMLFAVCAAIASPSAGGALAQAAQLAGPFNSPKAQPGITAARGAALKVMCVGLRTGTGWIDKSGNVVTVFHVFHDGTKPFDCPKVVARLPSGTEVELTLKAEDADFDLALLTPKEPLKADPLELASTDPKIGQLVVTWGYPGGYNGDAPLLAAGYLAGIDREAGPTGTPFNQWIVNAAFNHGNSGGPLLDASSGKVIGIVDTKVAPLSDQTAAAIQLFQNNDSGSVWVSGGSRISETQLDAMVLSELREQVQLVIGTAIMADDIRAFLIAHGDRP